MIFDEPDRLSPKSSLRPENLSPGSTEAIAQPGRSATFLL
jgi:hypothetical protein